MFLIGNSGTYLVRVSVQYKKNCNAENMRTS